MTYKKKGYAPWNKGMSKEEIKSHYKNGFKPGRKGLAYGLANMRKLIVNYKRNAKIRGIEYKLAEEQFKEITQKDCHYCGAKPNNVGKKEHYNGKYIYNGLDRTDNKKGYTTDNVVPCCKFCNFQKKDLTLQEFRDWIKKVYNNMVNKSK